MRLQRLKSEIGNLPNMITLGRLLLIPPVLWLVDMQKPLHCFFAMLVFLTASALDVVDGWLARSRGMVTFFGKFVDPLADKIMAMALLVYLAAEGRVQAWLVVLLLGREFYMSALRTLALGERIEIVADAGGKAKTSFQLIGICFVLVYYEYKLPLAGTISFNRVGLVFIYASLLISIGSAWGYTKRFLNELAVRDTEPEA